MTLESKIEEDFSILQSIIEASREIVIVLSETLQVRAFNQRAATIVAQFEGKDLKTGVRIHECIPVADPVLLQHLVKKALEGEKRHLTHSYYVRKRQKRYFDITFQPIKSGKTVLPYVIVFASDVTFKQEEASRVRELELGFSSIFQQVAVGVMLYDVNYHPIRVNKKFTELTGYTLDEYRKQGAWSITHPDYMEDSMELASRMLNGEVDCYELEKKYIHKDGHEVWIHLTATVVSNQDKIPRQIISVVQDISEQKEIEKELVAKNEELDNFVFKAAHDLKGPIASLLGLHSIVEAEEFSDENAMFYFRHYNTNVLRLNYVLENLIELARVKDASLKTEPVNVMEIVEQNLMALSHLPGYESIKFDLDISHSPGLKAQKTLLTSILQNLIENAIKYCDQKKGPKVWVKVNESAEGLLIHVKDNGIGMPKEVQEKIFDMFYRGTEQSKGSGLGLYIVKSAVDRLQGSLDVDSTDREGTIFTVTLPIE